MEQDSFDFARAPYGTDPRKLARTVDPVTSHEAAHAADTTRLEAMVHREIARRGQCIAADLVAHFSGLSYSSVTARFKSLEDKGLISCGPDKQRGPSGRNQRVMRSLREPE
jgi:DNA-binding MarR family transcriptional regulator